MKTQYDTAIRILLCDWCGAPLQLATTGGAAQCRHCGNTNQVGARTEQFVIPTPQVPEPQRVAQLRMQDNRPLLAPAAYQQLVEGGRIPPWRIAEATAAWQACRKEVRASPSNPEPAERLLFLTMLLSNHLFDAQDFLRQRAMFESALEVAQLPRHKQVLRGFLSRSAARLGDLAAAQQWLAPCDPRPLDLESDTAYRVSRAYIDTLSGNFQAVIQWLGRVRDEVPIQDTFDAAATVFRANALERLGDVAGATAALADEMRRGAGARDTIDAIVKGHPGFQLCPQSLPQAKAAFGQVAGQRAAQLAGGGAASGIIGIAVVTTIIPIVILVVVFNSVPMPGGMGIMHLFGWAPGLLLGLGIPIAIGVWLYRSGQRAKHIMQNGVDARGRVLAVNPTGTKINGVPRVEVRLMVMLPDRPPYEASTKLLWSGSREQLLQAGEVHLKVDPQRPGDVAIVM